MQDVNAAVMEEESSTPPAEIEEKVSVDTVSTHVLVEDSQVAKLRELSRRTRIAQSEYLREAVDDLLGKYGRTDKEEG